MAVFHACLTDCLQHHNLLLQKLISRYACRLKASTPSSICHKLSGLQDLYDCVESFLLLPLTQQALAEKCGDKWINELLDGFLRLLDVCGIIKDAVLQTKECTQKLQSIMRRRWGDGRSFMSEVRIYLSSRKDVKKAINRALKVKESQDNNHETPAAVNLLKELDTVTFAVFDSFLSFVAGSKSNSTPWPFVSKLVQPKKSSDRDFTTQAKGSKTLIILARMTRLL